MDIIPNLSVDCVIFGFDSKNLNVLLVDRTLFDKNKNVVFSDFTLTGNHVLAGEDPDEAAVRILNDLTGLHDIYMEQFHTFGSTERLTREKDQTWINHLKLNIPQHVISVGYYSLIDANKVKIKSHNNRKVRWFPINLLPELAFDHELILRKALEMLRIKLRQEPIGFELLADKFTLTQVQRLYEAILGTKFDARNFRKKLAQMHYVVPLDEKQTSVRHKPAKLYLFSREVYERSRRDRFDFDI